MRNLLVLSLFGLTIGIMGCDGSAAKAKLYSVSGKATAGGKPLANCIISFVSASGDGKMFGGEIAADGSFTLSHSDGRVGAEPGKYKVVLQVSPELQQKAMTSGGGSGPPQVTAPFPSEYAEASSSPKEVEVKAESNTINVEIP